MLIRHATIMTGGENRRVIHNGAVLIRDGLVCAVGDDAIVSGDTGQERVHDAHGMLLTPGLVCGRTELTRSLARLLLPLNSAADSEWRLLSGQLGYDELRYGTMLGAIEALQCGVTTVVDEVAPPERIEYSLDAAAEGLLQVGLRAALTCLVGVRRGVARAREAIEENARFGRHVTAEPRLVGLMGLDSLDVVGAPTLQSAFATAAMANLGYSIRLGTYMAEARQSEVMHGARPVARLRRLGVLGRRSIVGPCLSHTDDELGYLAGAGAVTVYAPRHLADAQRVQPSVSRMIEMGLAVCLGTDGYGHQLVGEAASAYRLSRSGSSYVQALTPDQVADSALVSGGAWASNVFGHRLGVIEDGAMADIVLWRAPQAGLLNEDNIARYLLSTWPMAAADTVLVGGEMVLRHGRAIKTDEAAIQARALDIARALIEG